MLINFTGDVFLADLLEKYKSGIGARILQGFDPFNDCHEYLKQGDLNIINLESVIAGMSSRKYPWSEIMRGNPEFINILKKSRIHAVNLANNHSMDHGQLAFDQMVKHLDEAGILHFGGPRDNFQENALNIISGDKEISILGYYIEETLPLADRDQLIRRIIENVRRIKSSRLLILSLHWGSEYTDRPETWMINAGKELIEAGVDILYGHHSHTFQGVAEYKNGLIAPGMGNFIFDEIFRKNRLTALLQVGYDGSDLKFQTIPLFIDRSGKPGFSHKVSSYIGKQNIQLKNTIDHPFDSTSWDRCCTHQSKKGHFKNRMKIRAGILMNPIKYYPFILHRNEN